MPHTKTKKEEGVKYSSTQVLIIIGLLLIGFFYYQNQQLWVVDNKMINAFILFVVTVNYKYIIIKIWALFEYFAHRLFY